MQILICLIFLVLFKKTRAFIEEDNPLEKDFIAEEGLDVIDIDVIRNLEDSPTIIFIKF